MHIYHLNIQYAIKQYYTYSIQSDFIYIFLNRRQWGIDTKALVSKPDAAVAKKTSLGQHKNKTLRGNRCIAVKPIIIIST